ncbi:Asparagine--tRNA ligase [Candidatus Arsenophonus lipoptenae]|uniref:Asparagine--tRNA ligase n=1 Tax=Candidatus Arsenophonus lipoptenae TaxID=634113 RepID=A0A120HPX8_9GAMM|nr:asparagine--tRNA ligase [Candidatus Arsenophonus lipoptenae]AMA65113.1 Asparagine--tRNA ligase [Candidatus Arsenophonus lipoptenae]
MNIVPIVKILQGGIAIGKEVTVRGWVRTRRDSKSGMSFLTIYDGSCFNSLQVIVNNQLDNYEQEVMNLTTGCSVEVTGIVKLSKGKGQKIELFISQVIVVGMVENPNRYPISAKHHSIEYLREVSHLRPRTNLIGAITRIRHTLAQAIHRFFNKEGYFWVSTPIITTYDTEGASKMFRVSTLDLQNIPLKRNGTINFEKDFFCKEAFLTVSGQLNGEAYACSLSKIYTFGPTFRAENSNTSRHLSEFWMVEPEVAFADLNNIISLSENMLKYVFNSVLCERYDDLAFFVEHINKNVINRLEQFIKTDFIQIDYIDAIKLLKKSNKSFKNLVDWGMDFSSEHERYLTEQYFKAPIVIKNYPKNIKAFYMRINPDGKTVAAMDVLVPGIGEILGGSQREERLNELDIRMREIGLNQEDYKWYRDLRRYGTVPHSGFGLGFERMVAYVTSIKNIREAIPFPRTPNNARF